MTSDVSLLNDEHEDHRAAHWLVSGGDSRIALGPDGLNVYGCSPRPRPGAISLASSTASTISQYGFDRVLAAWRDISATGAAGAGDDAVNRLVETARARLKSLLSLSDDTELVFSPSGTDAQLLGLFIVARYFDAPITMLVVGADETGSGTVYTASGRHFNAVTGQGIAAEKGAPVPGLAGDVKTLPIVLRGRDGVLFEPDVIDRNIADAVEAERRAGRKIVLQAMDCSKLGARSPSDNGLLNLVDRYRDDLIVMVDACQMRLSHDRLNWYLSHDCIVLITGSKFFTGPAFCGAMLLPGRLVARLRPARMKVHGLADYSSCYDWPACFQPVRDQLPSRFNIGQYLRWEAALAEMQRYFAVPQSFRAQVISDFTDRLSRSAARFPYIELANAGFSSLDHEFSHPTIFPFFVSVSGQRLPLDRCAAIYRALNQSFFETALSDRAIAEQECHIGQPVAVAGSAVLRLSADARLVSAAWSMAETGSDWAGINQNHIERVFEKIGLLLRDPALLQTHGESRVAR